MSDQQQPVSAAGYKQKTGSGTLVELPSGNWVRIIPRGMDVFLRRGMIPDSLTPLVRQAMDQAKKTRKSVEPDEDSLKDILGDPEKLQQVFGLFDDIVVGTWVEPKVLHAPENEDDRDPTKLYTDEIEFNDKVYTFQFAVGGVKDLESFRHQQEAMLERVSSFQDVGGQAE